MAAAFFVLGILFTASGLVIYILTSTREQQQVYDQYRSYIDDFFYYGTDHNHDPRKPTLMSIVLVSIGIWFIVLSFIMSILACIFGGDNRKRQQPQSRHDELVNDEEKKARPEKERLIDQKGTIRSVQVVETDVERLMTSDPLNRGDINTVGLPPQPTMATTNTIVRNWVPPNGFTYIANPAEIHSHRFTPARKSHRMESAI